ncbi:MAG: hypothetical protein DMF61_03400 [Blastocatellia bacterium AA13]|nr:MAG: hypothetical protein DMF61_03400 [Blastocatellia bacterium AA13]
MITNCPECGAQVTGEAQKFCYRCGSELPSTGEDGAAVPETPPNGVSGDSSANQASANGAPDAEAQSEGAAGSAEADAFKTLAINPSETSLIPQEPRQEPEATLRIVLATGDVFDREIMEAETRLGKGPRNTIVLADPSVSTAHALITRDGDRFFISDLSSRNGTFVGTERVTERRQLRHGDVIILGRSKLTFRQAGYGDTAIITSSVETAPASAAPPPLTEDSLAEALINAGRATREVIAHLRQSGKRLYDAAVAEKIANQESIRDLMSQTFKIPSVELKTAKINDSFLGRGAARLAIARYVLPLTEEGGRLILAVYDPTDRETIESIARESGKPVDLRLATFDELKEQTELRYGPKLVGVSPTGEKVEFPIAKGDVEIGKAAHNNIVLSDTTVSNSHAIIVSKDNFYSIVDLDSLNGTFVNGERLGAESRTLKHGDRLQFGQTILTFRNPAETTENTTATLSAAALEEVKKRAAAGTGRATTADPALLPASPPVGPAAMTPQEEEAISSDASLSESDKAAKAEKKKKKKKKKDERVKAAYISSAGRVVAQVLGVVLTVGLAIYIAQRGTGGDRNALEPSKKGKPKLKLGKLSSGNPIKGGNFEASGVVQVPESNTVLFVDDNNPGEVMSMELDEGGNQVGDAKRVPLGASIEDPESITYGGGFFYVMGSQSNPLGGVRNGLARFTFDSSAGAIQGSTEVIGDVRGFLLSNVPELKEYAKKPADAGGLNIEGISWDPDHERLLLGLRAPIVNGNALIVAIKLRDPRGAFTIDNLTLAEPHAIQVSLEGLGIRDIQYDSRLKSFLIISGASQHHEKTDFKLWEWSGDPDQSKDQNRPREESLLDKSMKPEGVTRARIGSRDYIFIVGDSGSYVKIDYSEGDKTE